MKILTSKVVSNSISSECTVENNLSEISSDQKVSEWLMNQQISSDQKVSEWLMNQHSIPKQKKPLLQIIIIFCALCYCLICLLFLCKLENKNLQHAILAILLCATMFCLLINYVTLDKPVSLLEIDVSKVEELYPEHTKQYEPSIT